MTIIEHPCPDPRRRTELTVPTADRAALLGVPEQSSDMQPALLSLQAGD